MFIYIPYGTDAPIYYRPLTTLTMIAVNLVVFSMFTHEEIEPFMLAMGSGLYPHQWLTANFLHADIFHLVFNMLFLWVFGTVIEGKIGSLKMLALYLGISVVFGALFQILTLWCPSNNAFGASGVIFGLAAMSFIWAPESKIHAWLIYWILLRAGIKDLETEISLIVGFFAVLQIAFSLLFGSGLIGELGHIVGALIGLTVAIVMLKKNLVDCEYGDIFSVWSGAKDRAEIEARGPNELQRQAKRHQERQKRQNLLAEEIELAIQNQAPLPAFIIARRKEQEFIDWTLPQDLHWKLIQQLLSGKHWTEATLSMRQYLERHQEQTSFVQLMLAQAFIAQNKPKSAMKVLDSIVSEGEQQLAIPKIRAKAETMHRKNLDEGIYEIEE